MIFSSFHHDSLRDTISWECIVEDDCVRSCLIELKSFLLSKFHVDPIHCVLMFHPRFLLVPCKTRCFQVNYIRISVFFVHRIHRREEYRQSFAQFFVLPVSILNRWVSLLLPATSESNSFIQLSLKEIVGGGRGDTYTISCMISPDSISTTFEIQ